MKLHYTLVALAVLGMGAAHAVVPGQLTDGDAAAASTAGNAVYVSGSSALRFSLASGFVGTCVPGTVATFGNTGATPGNNVRGYACTLASDIKSGTATAFAAGTKVVFNKYDAGGSINGIQPLVLNTKLGYLDYSACQATSLVRSGDFDLTKLDYTCAQQSTAAAGVVPQMGVSDVEAAMIQNKANLADGVSAVVTTSLNGGKHSVAMAGVAVNLPLYRALQNAQGLAQDDAEANAPSMPIGFLVAVQSASASPLARTGFNALIPSDGTGAVSDSGKQAVTFCTRANGSGTKAMFNAGLLSTPCSAQGVQAAGGSANAASVSEQANNDFVLNLATSTGGVISCMQAASTDASTTSAGYYKNWAIGIAGAENDPAAGTGGDAGWRFVKVSGAYPSLANGQNGSYPFTYENYMYYPKTLATKYSNFAKWLQTSAVTPLALAATPDVGTQNGILAIASYGNAAFASVKGHIARTTRNGNTCAPQILYQ